MWESSLCVHVKCTDGAVHIIQLQIFQVASLLTIFPLNMQHLVLCMYM